MLPFEQDDDFVRPVGAEAPAGRGSLGLRQILTVLAVLVLGGGLGTGAYFLSDVDFRDVIGLLDVADPQGPKLKLLIPGREAASAGDGQLLTPPGGTGEAPAASLPAAAEPLASTAPEPPASMAPGAEPPSPAPTLVAAAVVKPLSVNVPPLPAARSGKPPAYGDIPPAPEGDALAEAPLKDLLRDSPHGALPVVAADGRQPWKVYGRPFTAAADQPRVAVVVTGLGLDREATEAAITRLPPEVSLAFSPYAPDLDKWIKRARGAGHEALVTLPLEPVNFPANDPGPLALLTAAKPEDNLGRLETVLSRAPGAVGVAAPASPFTESAQLGGVLAALLQRGLLYVGSGARGQRVPPAAGVSLVVDSDPWRDAIEARLTAAATAAKARGALVVTASPRPVTLASLAAWMTSLSGQGLVAAPVSAVVTLPGKS